MGDPVEKISDEKYQIVVAVKEKALSFSDKERNLR